MVRKITWVSMMPAALPRRTTGSDCARAVCGAASAPAVAVAAPAAVSALKRRRVIIVFSVLVRRCASAPRPQHVGDPVPHVMDPDRNVVDLAMVEAAFLLGEDLEGLLLRP